VLAVDAGDADRPLWRNRQNEVFTGWQGVAFDAEAERDIDLHQPLAGGRLGYQGGGGEQQADRDQAAGGFHWVSPFLVAGDLLPFGDALGRNLQGRDWHVHSPVAMNKPSSTLIRFARKASVAE